MQMYADELIKQTKEIDELNTLYNNLKAELEKIGLTINTEKCEIISNEQNDIIKDETSDGIIISKKVGKYLGQLINNNGITENTIEAKLFGKLINIFHTYKGFSKSSKIRLFKTYFISKINHLLPLISLTGNIEISWKTIRKMIFKEVLNKYTLPLETAMVMGIGYYNKIVRPLIKTANRCAKYRGNNNEENYLKEAAKKSILYWLQT